MRRQITSRQQRRGVHPILRPTKRSRRPAFLNRSRLHRGHEHDSKAVVAFAADCLNRGSANAWLGRQPFVQTTNALHIGVATIGVDHRTVANDIVHDNQTARP